MLLKLVDDARSSGARLTPACSIIGICAKTYRRWKRNLQGGDKRKTSSRCPGHKLTEAEREMIITTCNQEEYASLPPSQIVPKLADKGIYIASESSFYRVLKQYGQINHRGRSAKRQGKKQAHTHVAHSPNSLWSWDITYCPSVIRGQYYYLYLIEDIFSRKIVGWEIYPIEAGKLAADLIEKTVLKEKCFKQPLILHSDNGAPMKSSTLLSKLYDLGITPSRSRPRVSNDNAYSESLFKTMKYQPCWPTGGFKSISEAQEWVNEFVQWYNTSHCHSGIKFTTPAQRHAGQDKQILEHRKRVYEQARCRNPRRWTRDTRNWEYQPTVTLNPVNDIEKELKAA